MQRYSIFIKYKHYANLIKFTYICIADLANRTLYIRQDVRLAAKRPLRDCACGEKKIADMDTRRIRYTVRLTEHENIFLTREMVPQQFHFSCQKNILTEHENIFLTREMELLGYRSVAKYFRDMAMKKHPAIVTCEKNADNIIQEKLIKFRSDFNKLGANYNQIVKRYNAIVRDAISKDCMSVSLYSLGFHTQKLEELTLAIIRLFVQIEKEVSANRGLTSPDGIMYNK